MKVAKFSFLEMKSHITKQLLTSISVDIRIYLPLTVIFPSDGELSLFQVDKI